MTFADAPALVGIAAVGLGLVFCVLGVVGLFRMPDTFTRMHAASKVITFGASLTFLGVALAAGPLLSWKAIGALAVILIATPIATSLVARAAHRTGVPRSARSVLDELARDRGERPARGFDDGPA